MTRKEFEKFRIAVEHQNFHGESLEPLNYGMQRALFDCEKYKRLIAAAAEVKFNVRTAKSKATQWKRQLERANQTYERLRKLKQEMDSNPNRDSFAMPRPALNSQAAPS